MAKNSIDNFFNDEIANHEWLDAKDKVDAPFATHNPWEAKETLAMDWMAGSPHPDVSVTKPNGDIETSTMDGHLVTQTADGKKLITDQDGKLVKATHAVVQEIKRQMMLGKTLSHIKTSVIDKLSPEVKVAAKSEIIKLAKEYPLLGSVYIETSPFSTDNGIKGCESGANRLKNNQSKMAIYAVQMDKCAGCSLNRGGICGLYKKQLVAEVKYGLKTLSHYQNHLNISRKIASDHKIASKEDLRLALLGEATQTREATSVVYHDESKLAASRKSSEVESFQSKGKRDLANELSIQLASMTPEYVKGYITEKYALQVREYPEVFKRYASLVGSLGRVFVELAPFQTVREAADYYKNWGVPYILSDGRRLSSLDKTTLGMKVVSSLKEIPMEYWVKNLRGRAFNATELNQNPLGVTKMAFMNAPVKASGTQESVNTYEIEMTSNAVGEKFAAKNTTHMAPKEAVKIKTATRTSSDNLTVQDGKVRVMADKGLEIEIDEATDFDVSVQKYL